jgi:hypothetical protein
MLNQVSNGRTRNTGFIEERFMRRNIVYNGNFDNNINGWSATSPAQISWSSGEMLIQRLSAGIDTDMCYQDVYLISGESYILVAYNSFQDYDGAIYFGMDGGAEEAVVVMSAIGYYYYTFTATGSLLRIVIKPTNNLAAQLRMDFIGLYHVFQNPLSSKRRNNFGYIDYRTSIAGNLIINGTFDVDTLGWNATSPATIQISSGTLLITRNGAGIDTDMCYQNVYLIPGVNYIMKYDLIDRNGATCYSNVYFGWDGKAEVQVKSDNIVQNDIIISFTALGNLLRIIFKPTNVATPWIKIDNVSLKYVSG